MMPVPECWRQMPAVPTSSGTYNFKPTFADWVVEAFERIQIGPTALEDARYIISARRSANLIALDLSANRGVNLWLVGDETLNEQKPIWVEPKSQVTEEQHAAFYQWLTHRADEKPLWYLHLSSDSPIQFHSILYCPQ